MTAPTTDLAASWSRAAQRLLQRSRMELVGVDIERVPNDGEDEPREGVSFLPLDEERALAVAVGLAAVGADLFGGRGDAAGAEKDVVNRVKKRADETASYALGEGLFMASRSYTDDTALMISLGEGTMVKGGETEAMGSNPTLGFGRSYCPPATGHALAPLVDRLLNDADYAFDGFQRDVDARGIRLRSAAVDPLEGTSRFAKGERTGPMVVLHVFDQPMKVVAPFESYVATLAIPAAVAEAAAAGGTEIGFETPRDKIVEAIEKAYPGTCPGDIAVWTLGGASRAKRIDGLWQEWRDAGARLVEDGEMLPSGMAAFTDSGTYAPTFRVGQWYDDEGASHVFVVDGYAASAEALQAATLAPALGLHFSMAPLTPTFANPIRIEHAIMQLDPDSPTFEEDLAAAVGRAIPSDETAACRDAILDARAAGIPLGKPSLTADDYFPKPDWQGLACAGYIGADPYTGAAGVRHRGEDEHVVTCQLAGSHGQQRVVLTLRRSCPAEELPRAFTCLVRRIARGEDLSARDVGPSEAGRIRNDLLTLVPAALEHHGERIRLDFGAIEPAVLSHEEQARLFEQLDRLCHAHPESFGWLELRR